MRTVKNISLLLFAMVLLNGCATRLGYPAKTVGIPTPVTLFFKVAPKATINNTMAFGAVDMWSFLYKNKFEDILAKLTGEKERSVLNAVFSQDVDKAKNLFAPSSLEVQDIGVDYAKTKNDPPTYSGFDFSQYKDSITTPYILALTLDAWGLTFAQENKDSGPYVTLTMQLIDKETNASRWSYTYTFQLQQDKDASEITNPDRLDDMLCKLILNGTNLLFMWLGW
ncbi:MAG: hypothetical protein ABSG38_09055 [Spirochaetia bacterium]|jgi:PBP1b-binding outer membrane lipoprotein LpoB